MDGKGVGGCSGVNHPLWRGRGIHGLDFTPLFIFVSRRGSGQRKETPRKQRQCRHLPRLGFPLWTPLSEAPPLQGMTKGGNPSPLRRERQICSRLRGPWGSGANPPWFALRVTSFAVFYFHPGRRQERPRPAPCGRLACWATSWGRRQSEEALDFRARKDAGLKAKG